MKKFFILIFIFQFMYYSVLAQSQKHFLDKMFLRSAIAYVADFQVDDDTRNHELTWSNQAGVSLTMHLDCGIQASYISVWGNTINGNKFYSAGIFLNYKFTPKQKFNLYLEGSFSKGNYCPCQEFLADPGRVNVNYIGIGPGIDYPIFGEKLRVSVAAIFHVFLNYKGSYNYGRLGLAYAF